MKKLALFKYFKRTIIHANIKPESHDLTMTTGGLRNQSKLSFFILFEEEAGCEVRPVSNVVLLPCRTKLIELNSTLARQ